MNIKFLINEKEDTEYVFNDFDEVSVHYEVNGVGVTLLGRPEILDDTLEIVIAPYSGTYFDDLKNNRLHCLTNQIIKIEVPSQSGGDLQLAQRELFTFCSSRLGHFFENDDLVFNSESMVNYLNREPAITVLSCAERDALSRKNLIQRAIALDLDFITEDQRVFARQVSPQFNANPNRTINKKSNFILAGGNQSIVAEQNPLTKELTIFDMGTDKGIQQYTICQPMPEWRQQEGLENSDELDVIVSVNFHSTRDGRRAEISRNGQKHFAYINLNKTTDTNGQNLEVLRALSEAAGASLCSSYFKRSSHVREAGDMYVAGFDSEVKERFKNIKFIKESEISLSDRPVVHVLTGLRDLGYLELKVDKSDSKSQKVYLVSGKNNTGSITTVEQTAISQNSWGGISPTRWLSPNSSLGTASNTSGLIGRLIDYGIIDLAKFNGNKSKALSDLRYEVSKYLAKNNETLHIPNQMNDGMGSVVKPEPPLPTPIIKPVLMQKFEEYLIGRGIGESVIKKAKDQKMIYTAKDSAHKECVAMISTHLNGNNPNYSVQKFILDAKTGRWDKKMVTGASIKGSSHSLKGSDERFVVLGEANIDMYSFLTAIELAGGNPNYYSIHSLMSAGYCDAWLESTFSIKLPKEGNSEFGSLVNTSLSLEPLTSAADALEKLFDQYDNGVKYVCDGRPESIRSKEFFNKIMKLAGLPPEKIQIEESRTRETKPVYRNTGVLVFDRTCLEVTMNRFGLYMTDDKNLEYYSKRTELVPIVTEEHKQIARERVTSVFGNSRFILAFDNDYAGHIKSIALNNLFKGIGVGVLPFVVPLDSKSGNEFNQSQVLSEIRSTNDVLDLKVSEFDLMNDVNDFLKKMKSSPEESKKQISYLLNLFKSNYSPEKLINDIEMSAQVFKDQKHAIKQVKYKDIFSASKKFDTAEGDFLKGVIKSTQFEFVKKEVSAIVSEAFNSKSIPTHHLNFMKKAKVGACLEKELPRANYSGASSKDFLEAKKTAQNLLSLHRQYGSVKSDPVKKKEWSVTYNASIELMRISYSDLDDKSKVNILKNKTVELAMNIVKTADDRKFESKPKERHTSLRPSR